MGIASSDYRAQASDGSPAYQVQPGTRSAGKPFGGKGAAPFGKAGGAVSKPPAGKGMSKGGRR